MMDIFNLSLTDDYINNLDIYDSSLLIQEAMQYRNELENEIANMIWGEDFDPERMVAPSNLDWDPALYEIEIQANPGFREKLAVAEELKAQIGTAMAIEATARIHLHKIQEELGIGTE